MNSLTLQGIEKAYNRGKAGEVVVLRGASITVAAGEVVALVAPSGAGKSTLLQIAGLLDVADAGSVHYGARQMTGLNDRARTEARRGEVGAGGPRAPAGRGGRRRPRPPRGKAAGA